MFTGNASPSPPLVVDRTASSKKLLVVDDDVETVSGLAAILREDGYTVDVVGSAEEALERFKANTYHLLLTDLLLPGKSGVELTKMIHDAAPATAIVLITGHATVKTRKVMAKIMANVAGDTVCDPFMGTGSTGVAAIAAGKRFTGIEHNPVHFKTAVQRITQAWADRQAALQEKAA